MDWNDEVIDYKLNATASLIVGDGRIYMYDKNGNIPVLEQWKFDGEVTYHHNSHHVIQPCLTRLQVFTGPIFAKNGEPQNTGTSIELVNFDDYYSSVSEEEFLEWKTYLLSKYANPRQILQYPTKVRGAMSWRIPHQIEPTRANAPNPKSGGEIAMRFGEVTWTYLPNDKTCNDYSFITACDGLEDMDALNPQIIANLLQDHKQEFQNYYNNNKILCHSSLQTAFSIYEKKHPRPPPSSPISKKLDWVLKSGNGLGPLSTLLDAPWIRSIQEARDAFFDYEQGNRILTISEIIAYYATARFSSDNVSLWVTH